MLVIALTPKRLGPPRSGGVSLSLLSLVVNPRLVILHKLPYLFDCKPRRKVFF